MKILEDKAIDIIDTQDLEAKKKLYNREQKVNGLCSKCGASYQRRLRFFSFPMLCTDCSKKETTLSHFGVENISQLDSVKKQKAEKLASQMKDIVEKRKDTCLKKYGETSYFKTQEYRDSVSGENNPGHTKEANEKRKQTMLLKYGVDNIFKRSDIIQKRFKEKYGCINPSQVNATGWPIKSNYLYKGIHFDSSWELIFYIYSSESGHTIEREPVQFKYIFNNEERFAKPDFRVDGQLIEIKGDFMIDENGDWQNVWDSTLNPYYKAKQKCLENNNVKVLTYKDLEKCKKYVYDKYTKNFIELFKTKLEFPYPKLKNDDMSVIRYFHKSIWSAHKDGSISPLQAWENKDLVLKAALNRLKYKGYCTPESVVSAFTIAKIAPRVSLFKVSLMQDIIKSFVNDSSLIVDPFSGFSGRMLGAINCKKQYIGRDISEQHIQESKEIAAYKNINVVLEVEDILKAPVRCYKNATLITCPPYSDKEVWGQEVEFKSCDEWIDVCLEKYECDSYIFIVDETKKYKNNIVKTIENKSHFNTNYEYVILFKKSTDYNKIS